MQTKVYVVFNQSAMNSCKEAISVHSTIHEARLAGDNSQGRAEIHCFLMDETEDLREERRRRMIEEIDNAKDEIRKEYEIGRL